MRADAATIPMRAGAAMSPDPMTKRTAVTPVTSATTNMRDPIRARRRSDPDELT
jgi:hypothetical protein